MSPGYGWCESATKCEGDVKEKDPDCPSALKEVLECHLLDNILSIQNEDVSQGCYE